MVQLEFHGAAGTVTGSMHLVHVGGRTVTLDCGLFQGRRAWARQKNTVFPVEARKIETVALSHAHLDHAGLIPRLVKQGFRGKVWATTATVELCGVMLADAAYLLEEDASYWNRKRAKGPEEYIEPLYTVKDVERALRYFRGLNYGKAVKIAPGVKATFLEAGHILGSAMILLEIAGDRKSSPVRLLYTGDMGRPDLPILRDPICPLPATDYLITECTYAGRKHDNPKDMKDRLVKIIEETRQAGGKVIIPAFSLGRTQNVVFYLEEALRDGSLKPIPIYVDSPLSSSATEVFHRHPEYFDREALALWGNRGEALNNGAVTYITEVEESKRLHELREPCVILSASGMCEGGRILHHLKNNVENKRNTVVVVGYMAEGTLGRRIVEKQPEIKVFGRMYKLRCRVETLNGFSAHADAEDFARCFGPIAPELKAAFLVHGETPQLEAMKGILQGLGCRKVVAPAAGEHHDLT